MQAWKKMDWKMTHGSDTVLDAIVTEPPCTLRIFHSSVHYIFVLWFLSIYLSSIFFSSPNLSGRGDWMSTILFYTWCVLSANL